MLPIPEIRPHELPDLYFEVIPQGRKLFILVLELLDLFRLHLFDSIFEFPLGPVFRLQFLISTCCPFTNWITTNLTQIPCRLRLPTRLIHHSLCSLRCLYVCFAHLFWGSRLLLAHCLICLEAITSSPRIGRMICNEIGADLRIPTIAAHVTFIRHDFSF